MSSFFAELKRRNVYNVAVAYAVVAWLLVQAASLLFQTFEAPPWVMKVVVILFILGFPAVLVLSWAFEITPEGIKRAEEVDPSQSITKHTGRKIVGLTIVLAILAVGLFLFQLLRPTAKTAATSPSLGRGVTISEKSIAVLPFQNLSDDKANAYFTEGIQDEILTRLSKAAALKVISRTSTQKYQTSPANLREVGQQLGVAHLLEGSVQKIANSVLINVQLIRAATDEHVWAESYNRKLDDVFAVEGEVASTIASQLNAQLTSAEHTAMTDKPTENVVAYDAYLRGISLQASGSGVESSKQAARAFAEAVRLDPNFALAWARLAIAQSYLYFNGIDPVTNSPAAVKEAADRALALSPQLGEALAAQGIYRYRVLRDFPGALESYTEAMKRLPNSSLVLSQMANVERRLGQWDNAEKHYRTAVQLDPRNLETLNTLSDLYQALRRSREAIELQDRILAISPGNESAMANKAFLLQDLGRLDESAKELARISPDATDDAIIVARALQFVYERRFEEAASEIRKSLDPRSIVLLGWCREWAGHKAEAREAFLQAVTAIKPSPNSAVPIDARQLPCHLAYAYAGLGEKEKALALARQAVIDYQDDILSKPFAELTLVLVQGYFGDLDAAFAALPQLLEVPGGTTPVDLRLNPCWDPLRKDPRFARFAEDGNKS